VDDFPHDLGVLDEFEWVEEAKAYRERLVPASRINGIAMIAVCEDE
jgi:hypothetical protein